MIPGLRTFPLPVELPPPDMWALTLRYWLQGLPEARRGLSPAAPCPWETVHSSQDGWGVPEATLWLTFSHWHSRSWGSAASFELPGHWPQTPRLSLLRGPPWVPPIGLARCPLLPVSCSLLFPAPPASWGNTDPVARGPAGEVRSRAPLARAVRAPPHSPHAASPLLPSCPPSCGLTEPAALHAMVPPCVC